VDDVSWPCKLVKDGRSWQTALPHEVRPASTEVWRLLTTSFLDRVNVGIAKLTGQSAVGIVHAEANLKA